jgi:hypothetical protein
MGWASWCFLFGCWRRRRSFEGGAGFSRGLASFLGLEWGSPGGVCGLGLMDMMAAWWSVRV